MMQQKLRCSSHLYEGIQLCLEGTFMKCIKMDYSLFTMLNQEFACWQLQVYVLYIFRMAEFCIGSFEYCMGRNPDLLYKWLDHIKGFGNPYEIHQSIKLKQ